MKLFEKSLFVIMAILAASSAVLHFRNGESPTWQIITLLWVMNSYTLYQRGVRDGMRK